MSSITPSVPMGPPMVQAPVIPGHRPMPMPGGPAFTIQDAIRILKRHIFLISGIFVVVMTVTVIGTFLWAKMAPQYTAVGMVEVKSPITPQALAGETMLPGKEIMEQAMNTHAAIIRSQGTFRTVLNDPVIKTTEWYRSFVGAGGQVDVGEAILDLEDRLSVGPVRDSTFIRVDFTWHDPKECATIANLVMQTYYTSIQDDSQKKTRNELKQYQDKANEYRETLRTKVNEQERFRAEGRIPLVQERRVSIGDQATALTQLLAQGQSEKDQAQAYYDMYNQPGAMERMVDTPEMRQMVDADGLVRFYTQSLGDLRIQLSTIREKGPKNKSVREMESRLERMEKELNDRKRQVVSDSFRDMRERTRVQLDTVNTQVIGLKERLKEAKEELSELEKQLVAHMTREQEIEELQRHLATIDEYVMRLKIKLDDPELVRISLASPAIEPLKRSSPRWAVNLPGGFVMGLLLGVGLAFLIEFMSTTIKTPADVFRQLNLPLLGQIPSQDEEEEATAMEMKRLILESPHSMLAESFRQLRANFLFCAPAEQQRSILVASCSPSEGKTCISINLGLSLALAGRKVLLVDANFRRPGVASSFGLGEVAEGLSNILIGHPDPDRLIQKTAHEHLEVLASGPLPPNPAELLSRGYLKEFIARYKTKYDTIIFDGPPLLVVSDAIVLSTMVDGVMLVVRAGSCARGAIQRARDQLRRVNAKMLGVVLNDVKATRGGYFKEMYKTYYEYQNPKALGEGDADGEAGKTDTVAKAEDD